MSKIYTLITTIYDSVVQYSYALILLFQSFFIQDYSLDEVLIESVGIGCLELYFFSSEAVVKDSLTTEFAYNS